MRFPIEEYLVPTQFDAPSEDEGWRIVDENLLRGLPHRIALTATTDLVLIAAHGRALTWLDLDPETLVRDSSAERAAQDEAVTDLYASLGEVTPVLVLRDSGVVRAALPLSLRGEVSIDMRGDGSGELLALRLLDADLRAGNFRGAGEYGGRLRFAWRHREQAVAHYSTPPINPYVITRLQPVFRMYSLLGLRGLALNARFTARQRALKSKVSA